jgi:hypothetical protein
MNHELKTWPEPFQAVLDNAKHHEVRSEADRNFAVGDMLLLREYVPSDQAYTGREVWVHVTYISRGPDWGLPPDMVCMSIVRDWSRP